MFFVQVGKKNHRADHPEERQPERLFAVLGNVVYCFGRYRIPKDGYIDTLEDNHSTSLYDLLGVQEGREGRILHFYKPMTETVTKEQRAFEVRDPHTIRRIEDYLRANNLLHLY